MYGAFLIEYFYCDRTTKTDSFYMDVAGKLRIGSPEEAAFRRCHDHLLEGASSPVKFAELLLSDGVITSETRDRIALVGNKDQAKEAVVDAVQCALAQSSNKNRLLSSLQSALEESGVSYGKIFWMTDFIAGE